MGIVATLDTAAAVWAVRDTLTATPRVMAAIVGAHDLLETAETIALRPSFPDPEYMQGRILAGATEAGVPLLGMFGAQIAPGHLAEVLAQDVEKRVAEAAQAARGDGFIGGMTIHPEVIGRCNAVFPGFKPPLPALQPPPPLPATWQPVVPSHFERKPSAPFASPTAPAPSAWQPVVPSHFGVTPQAMPSRPERSRPVVAPRQPGAPFPLAATWRPVVPSHFERPAPPKES